MERYYLGKGVTGFESPEIQESAEKYVTRKSADHLYYDFKRVNKTLLHHAYVHMGNQRWIK